MIRKLSLASLILPVATLLTLTACSRHHQAPRQAAQATPAATQAGQATAPPAPAAAASGGPVSSAQAADADSTSLEHLAAVPQSTELPTSSQWKPAVNYDVISPAQPSTVAPGKVEVLEVFSYGCPACNAFQPTIQLLKKNLPPNAQLAFLPAAFSAPEDWPMFQRAWFTAQALGIAERTHQQMYDAVWKTGELATFVPGTNRLKSSMPSIEDAARLYAHWTGITAQAFLAAAHSFSVDMKIRAADAQIPAMQVPGTPCIVVAGRDRVNNDTVRDPQPLIELVRLLVAKAGTL